MEADLIDLSLASSEADAILVKLDVPDGFQPDALAFVRAAIVAGWQHGYLSGVHYAAGSMADVIAKVTPV